MLELLRRVNDEKLNVSHGLHSLLVLEAGHSTKLAGDYGQEYYLYLLSSLQ